MTMTLIIRLPWWTQPFLLAACGTVALARLLRLPVRPDHVEALAEFCGQTVARHTRFVIAPTAHQ